MCEYPRIPSIHIKQNKHQYDVTMTSYMRQNGNKIIRPNVLNKVTQRYLYQNKKTSIALS